MDEITELLTEIAECQTVLTDELGDLDNTYHECGLTKELHSKINTFGVTSLDIEQLAKLNPQLADSPLFDSTYYSTLPTDQNLDQINKALRPIMENATLQVEVDGRSVAKGAGGAVLVGIAIFAIYKAYKKIRELIRRFRGKVGSGTSGAEMVVGKYITNNGDVNEVTFKVSNELEAAIKDKAVEKISKFYSDLADALEKLTNDPKTTFPKAPTIAKINPQTLFTGTKTIAWVDLKSALDTKLDKTAQNLLGELETASEKIKSDNDLNKEEAAKIRVELDGLKKSLNELTPIETTLLTAQSKANTLLADKTKQGDKLVGKLYDGLLAAAKEAKAEGVVTELQEKWKSLKKEPDASRSISKFASEFKSINDSLKSNHSGEYNKHIKGDVLTPDAIDKLLGGGKTWYVISK